MDGWIDELFLRALEIHHSSNFIWEHVKILMSFQTCKQYIISMFHFFLDAIHFIHERQLVVSKLTDYHGSIAMIFLRQDLGSQLWIWQLEADSSIWRRFIVNSTQNCCLDFLLKKMLFIVTPTLVRLYLQKTDCKYMFKTKNQLCMK